MKRLNFFRFVDDMLATTKMDEGPAEAMDTLVVMPPSLRLNGLSESYGHTSLGNSTMEGEL